MALLTNRTSSVACLAMMGRALACAVVLISLAGGAQAAICRVAPDGTSAADGSTWAQATALADATGNIGRCTEIWLKRGTYSVANQLYINRNVVLRGDFAGDEAAAADRAEPLDPSRTTLDGESRTRLLYVDGTTSWGPITADTLIEGLTLTNGNGEGAPFSGYGGAVLCDSQASQSACSPRFSYVVLHRNFAAERGGAVYVRTEDGSSNPSFSNVTFKGNTGAKGGGAVYSHAIHAGTSSPDFNNVTFDSNSALYGGAIYNMGQGGTSSPQLTNVTFAFNYANRAGGAVYNDSYAGGTSSPSFAHATFMDNQSDSNSSSQAILNVAEAASTSKSILRNSIVWGSGTPIINEGANSAIELSGSILQGGCVGARFICDAFTSASGSADPLLGRIQNNGGSTDTYLPGAGSPALDSAEPGACPATDQRGVARPQGNGCDIGAVEVQPAPVNFTITPNPGPNGTLNPSDPQVTAAGARWRFTVTPAAGYVIDQVSGCGGTLAGDQYTTEPARADCTVTASFRLAGTGPAVTPVPTLGTWSVLLLGLLAAGVGAPHLRKRVARNSMSRSQRAFR